MIPTLTALIVSTLVGVLTWWLMEKKRTSTGRGSLVLTWVVTILSFAIFYGIFITPCYLLWGYWFNSYPEDFQAQEIRIIDDASDFYDVVAAIRDDTDIVSRFTGIRDNDRDGIDDDLEINFGFNPHKRTMVRYKTVEPRRIVHTVKAKVIIP